MRIWTQEEEEKIKAEAKSDHLGGIREYVKNCRKCDFAAVIDVDSEFFSCLICDKVYCPKCDKPAHSGISCAENIKKLHELEANNKDQND